MNTLDYIINKYNLPSTSTPVEIPNVGRLDLLRWFRELDFKTGVEVGVESGKYAELICETNHQLKLYGVDPYLYYPNEYHEYHSQEEMDGIYNYMKLRMSEFAKHGKFESIRKTSAEALTDFKDSSLDFVYIDANHEGDFPYQDVKGWAAKVKPGGIVAGHDWVRPKHMVFTVKECLERYVAENNINPFFILGRYMVKPREIRDRTRSWMFIKT